jgi:hypothetical protein
VFPKEVPPVVARRSARRTRRVSKIVHRHGMGGRPAERVLAQLGFSASGDTVLRLLKMALSERQAVLADLLKTNIPAVATMRDLAMQLRGIFPSCDVGRLDVWLRGAQERDPCHAPLRKRYRAISKQCGTRLVYHGATARPKV